MIELTPVHGKSINAPTREAVIEKLKREGWTPTDSKPPFTNLHWLARGKERAVLMENDQWYMLLVVDEKSHRFKISAEEKS